MKYLYIQIWTLLALTYNKIDIYVFWPITKFFKNKVLKSNNDNLSEKFKKMDEFQFSFPLGLIDWYAFSFLLVIILLPLAIMPSLLDYKFQVKNGYTIYFIIVTIITLSFTIYSIYFKNKEWLEKEINKRKKKYSLSKLLENE